MPTDLISPIETPPIANQIELELDDQTLIVDRNMIRLGSSPLCEIQIPDAPKLHSVIHSEDGVLWIELDDTSSELLVNWRLCRRMALRDGDVISVAGVDITVKHQARTMQEEAARIVGDLSTFTADELCDRILSEQVAIEEFEEGRLRGWQNLMTAIQELGQAILPEQTEITVATDDADDCERLLDQIHELSDLMTDHTQELDLCEQELMAATSLLQETQDRVSQQIAELLDQIGSVPEPNELRASA